MSNISTGGDIRHVVTSGARYLDIDAYGGIIGEAELHAVLGQPAIAYGSPQPNESVTATIRGWGSPIAPTITVSPNDRFTLIDVSEPEFFDPAVVIDQVERVLDHHPGFEAYWHERLGEQAVIEPIGAACTLVTERWIAAGKLDRISPLAAGTLMSGILDNTLNFRAHIATDRDRAAYQALVGPSGLGIAWPEQYFRECQLDIRATLADAASNETKTIQFQTFEQPIVAGQLTLWDTNELGAQQMAAISSQFRLKHPYWFVSLIDIQAGHNRLISDVPEVQSWLKRLIGAEFNGNTAVTDRLWLRKELIAHDMQAGKPATQSDKNSLQSLS